MLDAFDLAKAILEQDDLRRSSKHAKLDEDTGDPIVHALKRFEKGMLQRSRGKVENSRTAASVLHTPAACTRANCVRAGAALGEEDPQNQTQRSNVDEKDANIVISVMKARMFAQA